MPCCWRYDVPNGVDSGSAARLYVVTLSCLHTFVATWLRKHWTVFDGLDVVALGGGGKLAGERLQPAGLLAGTGVVVAGEQARGIVGDDRVDAELVAGTEEKLI